MRDAVSCHIMEVAILISPTLFDELQTQSIIFFDVIVKFKKEPNVPFEILAVVA